MATYRDLLKYAATGQASPSMTYYDKLRASTLMGGAVQTLTGIPPLTFKADGTPLISWSMKGNGQQTGTPTPDNPVMPEFVGVRTGNLFDSAVYELVPVSASAQRKGTNLGVLPQGTYTFNAVSATSATPIYRTIKNGSTYTFEVISYLPYTFTADGVSEQIIRTSGTQGNTWADAGYSNMMLNSGSTPLPYEPYGWAEKITCAGQTVPVYLGQVQTVRQIKKKVFYGSEPWVLSGDIIYISNTDAKRMSPLICTHFPNVQNTGMWNGNNWIFQVDISTLGMTGRNAWIAYLQQQYANGTPVTVWYVLANEQTGIVNEPLCKIGTYADELSSEDASVTIPTIKGQNVLTVDTPIQPSEMTITYKG